MSGVRYKHYGLTGTRLYRVWEGMIARCYNQNCPGYINYGGAGIKVCEEWRIYKNFHDWATSAGYSDSLSLDRENNSLGYNPGNCRWATAQVQAINRGKNRNNKSGVTGVSRHKQTGRWRGHIMASGKLYYLGYFEDWFEAVCARKSAENRLHKPILDAACVTKGVDMAKAAIQAYMEGEKHGRENDWDAVVAAAGLMDSLAVKGNAFACENERDEMIDTYYVRVIAAHLNEP